MSQRLLRGLALTTSDLYRRSVPRRLACLAGLKHCVLGRFAVMDDDVRVYCFLRLDLDHCNYPPLVGCLQHAYPTEQSLSSSMPPGAPALGAGFDDGSEYMVQVDEEQMSPSRLGESSSSGGGGGGGGGVGGGVGGTSADRELPPSVLKILVTNNVAGGEPRARFSPAFEYSSSYACAIFL